MTALSTTIPRRQFLTYLVAAPTLTIGGHWVVADGVGAVPPVPGPTPSDFYDLGDALTMAAAPTMPLLRLELTPDGRARFALPRMEVGQGITTTVAMLIAEELSLRLDRVDVTLSDADPLLLFNQFTGGSVATRSLYQPVSRMAAAAREQVRLAGADRWGVAVDDVAVRDGTVTGPAGQTAPIGSLSQAAAGLGRPLSPAPKPVSQHRLVGSPQTRIDAREMVTGRREYTLDLAVPGAKPAVALHAPQIKGTLRSFDNEAEIRAMPGVLDVATIRAVPHLGFGEAPARLLSQAPTAIIILADTFGQALAAQAAVRATWNPGSNAGKSDVDLRAQLRAASLPVAAPAMGRRTVDGEFEFAFVAHAPLETMCAVADVRGDRAEVWSGLKVPVPAQQEIAEALGLLPTAVTVHVVPAGGSFGRRLFHEAALEAALASKAFGRPVRLMWSRSEDMKHDRLRPATHHRIRATTLLGTVLSFEHRFTSGATSYSHGMGDALTSIGAHDPLVAGQGFSQTVFNLMMTQPYHLGVTTQTLREVDLDLYSGSWRSVYTGTGRTAEEIMMDELAAAAGADPVTFRLQRLKEDKAKRVLRWVADQGRWGRRMPSGTAQGIGVNAEHRSAVACLVELDARGAEPRVTKAVMAFDAGLPINPSGLEAQMLGSLNDGISTILRASVHIDDGAVRESSYGDFRYARQAHSPRDVLLHVFPAEEGAEPGGAGETGVAACAGAVANAFARATGTKPRSFPIGHEEP